MSCRSAWSIRTLIGIFLATFLELEQVISAEGRLHRTTDIGW
jgi:hypothetical protein